MPSAASRRATPGSASPMRPSDDTATRLSHWVREAALRAAESRAMRERLEHQRKVVLALSMKAAEAAGIASISGQERDARCSTEYVGILDDLYEAAKRAELDQAEADSRELYCRLWQTEQANERTEARIYGST